MGSLHPVEQVATILLAFGPFLVLGVVVVIKRRQDAAEERAERDDRAVVEPVETLSEPATPDPSDSRP